MGINRGIAGSPCQALVVLVWDVGAVELVLFGESEIDDEDSVGFLFLADEKVVRLDVSVDKTLIVDVLNSLQDLKSNHDCRFSREGLPMLLEEGLEGTAQHPHHHHSFVSFREVFVHLIKSHLIMYFQYPFLIPLPVTIQDLQYLRFVVELGIF